MTHELQVQEPGALSSLSPKAVLERLKTIQTIMHEAMKEGTDYGTVPGCGDKPTLLQPGAQTLAVTFQLGFETKVAKEYIDRGHMIATAGCRVFHQPTGQTLGYAEGVCSTMEGKYRFRNQSKETPLGKNVPREYWDAKKTNANHAQELLIRAAGVPAGTAIRAKKNDQTGNWEIVRVDKGDRVEHDNPADYYNTVVKIAAKRAEVKGAITVTGASSMFTQDLEDLDESIRGFGNTSAPKPEAKQEQPAKAPAGRPAASTEGRKTPMARNVPPDKPTPEKAEGSAEMDFLARVGQFRTTLIADGVKEADFVEYLKVGEMVPPDAENLAQISLENLNRIEDAYFDGDLKKEYLGTTGAEEQGEPSAEPTGGWRDVVAPFGKHKDKTLGEIEKADISYLGWLCRDWTPRGKPDPTFMDALKAAQAELSKD